MQFILGHGYSITFLTFSYLSCRPDFPFHANPFCTTGLMNVKELSKTKTEEDMEESNFFSQCAS